MTEGEYSGVEVASGGVEFLFCHALFVRFFFWPSWTHCGLGLRGRLDTRLSTLAAQVCNTFPKRIDKGRGVECALLDLRSR